MRAKTEKDLWSYENGVYAEGYGRLCGVDEAGRGPLAGPVCAAAVTLPRDLVIPGLDDSKKLTEKRREALFDVICREAEQYSVAFATVEEIEELNILGATYLAMNRAIAGLEREVQLALIDGDRTQGIECRCRSVVGGDGLCADIAAASVLAKVTKGPLHARDGGKIPRIRLREAQGLRHGGALRGHTRAGHVPHTPAELPAADALMDRRKLAGRSGEAEAAKYLRSQGYELLGMNYACRGGEIDIIAAGGGYVAFVEVKLRASDSFAAAREAVTPAKQRRIRLAALTWLGSARLRAAAEIRRDRDIHRREGAQAQPPGECF